MGRVGERGWGATNWGGPAAVAVTMGLRGQRDPRIARGAAAGAGGDAGLGQHLGPAVYLFTQQQPNGAGGGGERKRLASAGQRAAGVPPHPWHCPPRACAAPQPAGHASGGRRDEATGPPEPARGSLARGAPSPRPRAHPRPHAAAHPPERGLWVGAACGRGGRPDAGMLGRASGRHSYSPYAAGRRRTGKGSSPKGSLDSLPRTPSVRLTVRGRRGGTGAGDTGKGLQRPR